MNTRNFFVTIHLYLSLFLGAVLAVVGITGSIIVFDEALDEILNPELLAVEPGGEQRPVSKILAAAKEAYPNKPAAIIHPPKDENGVFIVWFKTTKEDLGSDKPKCCSAFDWYQVMVNPYTAEVLGKRNHSMYGFDRRHIIKTMHGLHSSLLMGSAGRNIVGIAGILWLAITLTGIYLWWPKNGRFKMALTLKKGANPIRFNFDLHRISGIYSAVIILVVAFTGVYIIYPEYIKPAVKVFSPIEELQRDLTSQFRQDAKPISIEKALAVANTIFPNAQLTAIGLPLDEWDTYKIYKRQEGEVRKSKGKSVVWVDQYSANIIKVQDPAKMSAGETFVNWQFPLHTGEAFGMAGRLLVLFSGIATAVLVVTGTIIWYRKKRMKYLKLQKNKS